MHQANLNTDNGRMPQNIKCQKQIKNNEIIQQARKKKTSDNRKRNSRHNEERGNWARMLTREQ